MQAGFGAKAKNLLQLRTEERGVSWRWETNKRFTWHICECLIVIVLLIVHFFSPLTSIGGDQNLETVTTLPSESYSFPDIAMHMSTTRWQSWITTKLEFGLLCSHLLVFFFFLHQISWRSLILISKDGQREEGQPKLASTWLCQELKYREFSGSNGSPSCIFLLCFNHFVLILLRRGIPGQVRRLIDNMKKDPVS